MNANYNHIPVSFDIIQGKEDKLSQISQADNLKTDSTQTD